VTWKRFADHSLRNTALIVCKIIVELTKNVFSSHCHRRHLSLAGTVKCCEVCYKLEPRNTPIIPKIRSNIHEALLSCGFQAKAKFKFPSEEKARKVKKQRNKGQLEYGRKLFQQHPKHLASE